MFSEIGVEEGAEGEVETDLKTNNCGDVGRIV